MSIATPIPREWRLLLAVLAMVVLAVAGPSLAQMPQYHAFADQQSWGGVPHGGDVLSNIAFAFVGAACLLAMARARHVLSGAEQLLLALTGAGLLATCAASTWYHLAPDDARLVVDRVGMVFAFSGLLGLAACRVSSRAGLALALTVLAAGPLSMQVFAATGNLWPWVVVQGGGAVLLLALAATRNPAALPVHWGWVVGLYATAKVLEICDHVIWSMTAGLVSGHALKHVVAALAVLPVAFAVASLAPRRQNALKLPARAA